ncbi:uncharacterized protein LOC107227151 isoform X2 [Neodiprion lecontei]|uniref:Uncharacterized protein LOC107227151 isoform X2 n=1 Tax=Neodiprion lecontei TaxID=441921 RepID=A0ABM3FNF0_NEOLC|nr:uncharacterized protein LOC107227151 isoform X2 [Neodiprion lecontei]
MYRNCEIVEERGTNEVENGGPLDDEKNGLDLSRNVVIHRLTAERVERPNADHKHRVLIFVKGFDHPFPDGPAPISFKNNVAGAFDSQKSPISTPGADEVANKDYRGNKDTRHNIEGGEVKASNGASRIINAIDEDKDVISNDTHHSHSDKKNNSDVKKFVVAHLSNSHHEERRNHAQKYRTSILVESCKLPRSNDGSSPDDNLGPDKLNTKLCCCNTAFVNDEKISAKPPKCGNENTYKSGEDSAVKFSNGISRIILARKTSFPQNEKTKTPSDDVSSTETSINNKNEVKPTEADFDDDCVLSFADYFFSTVIIAPMVIGHWRGYWTLMDMYFERFPAWGSILVGSIIQTILSVLKYYLDDSFAKEIPAKSVCTRLGYRMLRTVYTCIFSTGCIMQWRGAWTIFIDFTAYEWITNCATVICLIVLMLLRCIRDLLSSPFTVGIDNREYTFKFTTRFNVNTRDWSLYILDCAFSVGVVGTLVVFVWRGVWASFDLYLFPDNAEYSAVGSVVIGYTFVVITFSLQPIMCCICDRLKGLSRLIVADLFMLLSFVATVNVWRGVWNVLDLWFLPEDPELSCWITHLGCFIFLVLLNCSNSILVRGVYIDGYEDGGQCVVFPCHYLRLFFKIEREKKAARRQNIVVASRDLATIRERTGKEENGILINTPNSGIAAENPESLV